MFIRRALALLIVLVFAAGHVSAAEAKGKRISLIRDAEIEALLADYTRPLMKAAGMPRGSVRILVANDPSFNAFVSGKNMVINTGLILTAETPNEVIGVIAHELGHMIGGHQVRLAERARSAQIVATVGTLLGLGAGIAGAASGSGDAAKAGSAIALGSGSAAMRGVLAYQRDEEANADRTAARLLAATGQSGRGMLRTFDRFQRQLGLVGRVNPYRQSHPMPRERIAMLRTLFESSKAYGRDDPKSLQERHDLARVKIAAYVGGNRGRALLTSRDISPVAHAYGRTILTHLRGSPRKAVPMIDRLIKQRPKNPYFHEMKGEIMLRSGKPKSAVGPFTTAIKLDRTGSGFLRTQLGHALVESGGKANAKKAVAQIKKGLTRDPSTISGYMHLARAYFELGRDGDALLANAEVAYRTGRKRDAIAFARRAQAKLKRGSPAWVRAQDIVGY